MVMTSPLQGEGRRFDPGQVHSFSRPFFFFLGICVLVLDGSLGTVDPQVVPACNARGAGQYIHHITEWNVELQGDDRRLHSRFTVEHDLGGGLVDPVEGRYGLDAFFGYLWGAVDPSDGIFVDRLERFVADRFGIEMESLGLEQHVEIDVADDLSPIVKIRLSLAVVEVAQGESLAVAPEVDQVADPGAFLPVGAGSAVAVVVAVGASAVAAVGTEGAGDTAFGTGEGLLLRIPHRGVAHRTVLRSLESPLDPLGLAALTLVDYDLLIPSGGLAVGTSRRVIGPCDPGIIASEAVVHHD